MSIFNPRDWGIDPEEMNEERDVAVSPLDDLERERLLLAIKVDPKFRDELRRLLLDKD